MKTELTTRDNAEIIAAAVEAARPKSGQTRGNFPRFNVRADGETRNHDSVRGLERELSTFLPGETLYIFRNTGYGATITGDKPDWWDARVEFDSKYPALVAT